MVSGTELTSSLSTPQPLELEGNDTASKWKELWEIYEIDSGVEKKSERIRVATFLHVAGVEAQKRYNGFIWSSEEDKGKLEDIIFKFEQDCVRKTNIIAERIKFLQRKQHPDENCDRFVNILRTLIASCDYSSPNEMLRDQFILNIREKKLQEKILRSSTN